jgi:hypothetical protein
LTKPLEYVRKKFRLDPLTGISNVQLQVGVHALQHDMHTPAAGSEFDRVRGETVSAGTGVHRVGGDRMVGSWSDMNQGSRSGEGTAFMVCGRPEEPCPEGDRAFVVARKRGNARGAKGGRKVEA